MKKFSIFIIVFALGLLSFVEAANDKLPEPMVGQAELTSPSGGFTHFEICIGSEFTHSNNDGWKCTGSYPVGTPAGIGADDGPIAGEKYWFSPRSQGDNDRGPQTMRISFRTTKLPGYQPVTRLDLLIAGERNKVVSNHLVTCAETCKTIESGAGDGVMRWSADSRGARAYEDNDFDWVEIGFRSFSDFGSPVLTNINLGLIADNVPGTAAYTGMKPVADGILYQSPDTNGDGAYDIYLARIGVAVLTTPWDSSTYFSGIGGNETVINYMNSGQETLKKLGPSLEFGGSASDYVSVPYSSNFNMTDKMSMAMWIKTPPSFDGTFKNLINKESTGKDYNFYATSNTLDGKMNGLQFSSNSFGDSTISIPSYDPSTWHFIAVSVSKSGGFFYHTYYYDIAGKIESQTSSPISGVDGVADQNAFIKIGGAVDSSWNGMIDEVRIYGTQLGSSEINTIFNGNTFNTIALKGYWDFNEINGNVVVDKSGKNADGTINGNVTIKADGPELEDSDEFFGFEQSSLNMCIYGILNSSPLNCFARNTSTGNINVMNSRTYLNGIPIIETATLIYPDNTIIGDVYGSMDNFAFWGRNLHQQKIGNPTSDATWKTGNYILNPNAQSTWDETGTQYIAFKDKVNTMKGEAYQAGSNDTTPHELQNGVNLYSDSFNNIDPGATAASKYPEGKIWVFKAPTGTKNLRIRNISNLNYSKKGTIIVTGDLIIDSGVNILPSSADDKLGFIVYGNVTIGGNNKIEAPILSLGDTGITLLGNNIEMIGSYVAKGFPGISGLQNIRFFYDYDLNNEWPPGFRYLDMPQATE